MSPTTVTIPIIDIGPYLDGSDKVGVAKQIHDACCEIGFFMIRGHGVPQQLLEDLRTCVNETFFDRPESEKLATMGPFGLGYMGQGKENVASTLKEGSKVVDYKESLNITLPVRDPIWPPNGHFRQLGEEYYKHAENLSMQLMRMFALALNLDEHYFDEKVNHPYTTLRLLNYPEFDVPAATEEDDSAEKKLEDDLQTRNAEHTDYGTLTLLWSNDSRGLQANTRAGEWIDVVAPSDCFIVNIGDLMMNWTNDKWISTLHRVVPHPETLGQRRFSMPFFHNPNPDAMITCIESCCDPVTNPPKYKPMIAKEHLEMKLSKALGTVEKMSDLDNEAKTTTTTTETTTN